MRSIYAGIGLVILCPCLLFAQYWRTPAYGYGVQMWQGFVQVDTTKMATVSDVTSEDIGQVLGSVFVSREFTDVTTGWVDVYVTKFDAEEMLSIDFTNIDSVRVAYMVDFVGSGTDSVRWVNVADNTALLIDHKYTDDCNSCTAGWIVKPAAFTGVIVIEMQAKSNESTNDPIVKGYTLWGK